jgi:hypothetical protein
VSLEMPRMKMEASRAKLEKQADSLKLEINRAIRFFERETMVHH